MVSFDDTEMHYSFFLISGMKNLCIYLELCLLCY